MSNINYSMIVAVSDNNVIGKNGTMPWHLKTDLQRFKKLTENHTIIMGKNCFNSIGKPLPNRTNIVVSSNTDLEIPGCIVKPSLQYAADYANSRYDLTPFIIGGGTLYRQAINLVNVSISDIFVDFWINVLRNSHKFYIIQGFLKCFFLFCQKCFTPFGFPF